MNILQKIQYGLSLTCLAFALCISGAASAQDIDDLADQIDRLERQVRALQRTVFQGEPPANEVGRADGASISDERVLLADMEVRIGQMDTALRGVTGEVERALFELQQLRDAFDTYRRDMDLRLQDIEARLRAGGGDGAVPDESAADQAVVDTSAEDAVDTGIQLPDGAITEQYQFAFDYMMRGDYAGAEEALTLFLAVHPDHELASNAQYWLGESYYVRRDFSRALEAFFDGYTKYENGNKAPDSLLKLGLSLVNLGQQAEACAAFQELEVRYPNANPNLLETAVAQIENLGC